MYNCYGPTETTIYATYTQVKAEQLASIGRPISNMRLYVLDQKQQLVPNGVAGEICISGIGVGRGYLNRLGLTAEKFIANPFGSGDRLYRTGDLGRYLPDGNVEFLGRIDNQVKIRGFRIELGEIESEINDCAKVKTSVALAKDGQLVAYIVPRDIRDLEELCKFKTQQNEKIAVFVGKKVAELVESVRAKISQKLPEYMVPSYFVVLEKIPLTPSGKIDGQLLQTLDIGKRVSTDEYIAPRNETERKLCKIWQEVLHLDKTGINDNFFKIGGDSILAIQVVSRAKKQNLELSVKDIFACQTVTRLAEIATIRESEKFEYIPQAFELSPIGKEEIEDQTGIVVVDAYPLSHLQEGFLFQSEYAKGSDAYFVQNVLHLKNIKPELLKEAWNSVTNAHDILKAGVLWEGMDGTVLYIPEQLEVLFETWEKIGGDLESFIQADRMRGFDLRKAPLMRVSLIRKTASDYVMIWSFHHIILDGWSSAIIIGEVLQAYVQLLNGKPLELKERKPYREYIGWLKRQDKTKVEKF